ncbi:SPASM domain-containing protein [Thermoanaerobacterium thermosaccharolyticum]|nr:SPASM domain-containing protein [Thermoanaerobacterium thermosaccharolyticum]
MHLSEKFKELNKTLKTKAVERYFVPKGRGKENVLQYYSMDTALPMYIPENLYRHADLENKKISSCACNAFKSQISINYDGNIYPCPSLIKEEYNIGSVFDEEVVTNLKNKNLDKIEAYKRFQEIYPYNFYKCSKCDVNIFCWHCPAILDSVKEDDKEFNKWCNLMKPILNKIVWDEEVI